MYRYSRGVGLSYKFNKGNVLERKDIEQQNTTLKEFKMYDEFTTVKSG